MKAHEPQDFLAVCEKAKAETFNDLPRRINGLEEQKRFAATFRRLSHFYNCRLWAFGNSSHFDTEVAEIKDIEPALQLLEEECGVKFVRTSDDAGENYASRAYTSECGKLVVNATVRGDSKNCRSVLVGEELVPKYKLVCDDDPPAAEAPDALA